MGMTEGGVWGYQVENDMGAGDIQVFLRTVVMWVT